MPWDRTTLYVVQLEDNMLPKGEPVAIHGDEASPSNKDDDDTVTSVYAPQWHDGCLYFLSNRTQLKSASKR
jgi:hypothetical protein